MKQTLSVALMLASTMALVGCATSFPRGGIYTDLKLPVDAESNMNNATKVGTAKCQSVLALVATGDCSIETAMKNGGISKVHHVDWEANNVLGVIGNYKLTVYGE